jgi:short-subunit dehydrogenase
MGVMKKAIIVGASSGIGRELARILVADDYRVGVTGRRRELLEELKAEKPESYIIRCFDIQQTDTAIEKLEELRAELGGIDLVVISSGTGHENALLAFQPEKETIDTNVTGFTNVACWAFREFKKQQHGQLVAISSIAGIRGSGEAPAYNASKAYQINYLEGLRQKAKKTGYPIYITDIEPGFVNTDMAKGEGLFWVMPVEKTTRQIYRAIRKRRRVAIVTRRWRLIALLLKIIPRPLYDKM